MVFKIPWGGEIFYFNNLTYPENSSSESGSASEPCFLEVFSGCLCMVEVRAGLRRALSMRLLSNQELDTEPGAYTVLSLVIPFFNNREDSSLLPYKVDSTCFNLSSGPPQLGCRGFECRTGTNFHTLLCHRRVLDPQRPLIHSDRRPREGSTGTLWLQKGRTKVGGTALEKSNKNLRI